MPTRLTCLDLQERRRATPTPVDVDVDMDDEHSTDSIDSSESSPSLSESALRSMRLPGEREELSPLTPSLGLSPDAGSEAKTISLSFVDRADQKDACSPTYGAGADLPMAPPTVSVSRYGGTGTSPTSKDEDKDQEVEFSSSIVQMSTEVGR